MVKLKGKRKGHREGMQKAPGSVRGWRFHGEERTMSGTSPWEECRKTEEPCKGRMETCSVNTKMVLLGSWAVKNLFNYWICRFSCFFPFIWFFIFSVCSTICLILFHLFHVTCLPAPALRLRLSTCSSGRMHQTHGENGVTSDAFLEALVACKDRVSTPEFRWLPQAPPQSVAKAHTLLLNSVAHYAERLESDAVVLFGWNLGNGNLRRAAGGLARRPPPQRRPRSARRNFTVDISDSDDEFGLPYGRLSPSSSDAVHFRRPYTKREGSNEWEVDKARREPITKHERPPQARFNFYATTKQGGGCFARVLKLRL